MGEAAVAWVGGALAAGGIAVLASRKAELIRKWRTWTLAAVLVIGCLWLGRTGAAALAAGLGVVAAAEFGRLTRLRVVDTVLLGVVAAALPWVAWAEPGMLPRAVAMAVLAMAVIPVLTPAGGAPVVAPADVEGCSRRAAAGVGGACWLAALSGLVLLRSVAVPLVFAVAVADVGGWCAGRAFGGPHLSPMSPAKRWSGVAGGAFAGCAALAVTGTLTPVLAVAVAAGAPVGDLLESMVKRGAGVKDAGGWLPGFGGLLDRIDSLLLVLALAVIL
jgi:phosphatidate cytidylyltransferase